MSKHLNSEYKLALSRLTVLGTHSSTSSSIAMAVMKFIRCEIILSQGQI